MKGILCALINHDYQMEMAGYPTEGPTDEIHEERRCSRCGKQFPYSE